MLGCVTNTDGGPAERPELEGTEAQVPALAELASQW